mgnify:FL=1
MASNSLVILPINFKVEECSYCCMWHLTVYSIFMSQLLIKNKLKHYLCASDIDNQQLKLTSEALDFLCSTGI